MLIFLHLENPLNLHRQALLVLIQYQLLELVILVENILVFYSLNYENDSFLNHIFRLQPGNNVDVN